MQDIYAKKFNFNNIRDMSLSQLNQHYTLYTRYVDTINKVNMAIINPSLYLNCSSNFSDVRNVQKALTFNLDAVKLHELYFQNMTGLNTNASGEIMSIIDDNFSSYNNFVDKFKCIAMAMRGWVTLCYDSFTNSYYIYGQDTHNTEFALNTYPLIVLDVYEHAYMIDFGIDKKKYIDVFFDNLDFKVINNRVNVLRTLLSCYNT